MPHTVPHRDWSYPTAIKFGVGRVEELARHCKASGIEKPLFVTDTALAALPITTAALDGLAAAGLGHALFSGVDPNPNEGNMAAGMAAYLAGGHDGVICFGGGSALDLGKMIALMAHQERGLSVWDLEDIDDWYTRADANVIAPIIAVPTTAGTGS
jgi:alcohol dehydrogenase class IV